MALNPIIAESARVGATTLVGVAFRPLLEGGYAHEKPTVIGPKAWVGEHCVIGAGAEIGEGAIIDHYCYVEADAVLEDGVLLVYRAHVCAEARIGKKSIVGGFIGERTWVGSGCRIFGSVVHHHVNPLLAWDAESSVEPGARILDDVFIGFGAIVTRPVSLGPRAYVCAGAIVSRSVPPHHVAFGNNQIVPRDKWNGPLRDSPFWMER